MSSKESPGCRLGIFHDTRAPAGSADYTTLVILHGYVWHSAIFARLPPLAKEHNVRLILLNRRGYPGSTAYTDEELAAFPAPLPNDACKGDVDHAREKLELLLRERTHELLRFLEDLVRVDNIPPAQRQTNTGVIVVVGWSFAALMIPSLMSYGSTFPASDVDLRGYLRRVVMHDPGHGIIGYPGKEGMYQPALDVSLPGERRAAAFDAWISGYYAHGSTLDSLGESPLADPPSTISTMSAEEKTAMTYQCPDVTDLDLRTLDIGTKTGLMTALRERSLYLSGRLDGGGTADAVDETQSHWSDVEVRLVWCERSVMEVAYGTMLLRLELGGARGRGAWIRDVSVVRVREGNHFVHWDHPDLAMRAFLGDEHEI